MSVGAPERHWWKPVDRGERVWIGLAIVWCVILFIAMPLQHMFGKQNSTGEAYRVAPADYMAFAMSWVDKHKAGTENLNRAHVGLDSRAPDEEGAHLPAARLVVRPPARL
jgi:hypothetical protein